MNKDVWIPRLDKGIFYALCGLALSISLSIAASNVFCGLLILLFIIRLAVRRDDWLERFRQVDKYILLSLGAFFIATVLSLLFSGDIKAGAKILFNQWIVHFCPFLLAFFVADKKKLKIIGALIVLSVTLDSFTAIKDFLVKSKGNLRIMAWFRPSSFMNVMAQANYLIVLMPILLERLINLKDVRYKNLAGILLIVSAVALFINAARGAWLAEFIMLPFTLLWCVKDKKKAVVLALLVPVLVFGVHKFVPGIHQRMDSIVVAKNDSRDVRVSMWRSAYDMFKDYPVLGVGLGRYPELYKSKYIYDDAKKNVHGHPHSNIMYVLSERGIVGAATFLAVCGAFFWYGWRNRQKEDCTYFILFMTMSGFFLYGLTDTIIRTAIAPKFLWLVMALCLRWQQLNSLPKTGEGDRRQAVEGLNTNL